MGNGYFKITGRQKKLELNVRDFLLYSDGNYRMLQCQDRNWGIKIVQEARRNLKPYLEFIITLHRRMLKDNFKHYYREY